jgi:uncharacterized membrane protein
MIDQYLQELRTQLVGVDPAVAQDALYDAEDYLRSELAEAGEDEDETEAFASIVERYGSPEEVAAAYLESEATVAAALAPPAPVEHRSLWGRFFGIAIDPRAWGSFFYMFLAFATGIVYFTFVVTGLSLSVGLAILIIGVPFMLLFLAVVRAISLAEGRIVEGLLGERMPRRPRLYAIEGNLWERIKFWLADYRTWTTMLYMALQLPLGVIYFSVLVTVLSLEASMILSPVYVALTGEPVIVGYTSEYAYILEPWALPAVVFLGILGFFVTLHATKLVGKAHAAYAKVMLVGRFSD